MDETDHDAVARLRATAHPVRLRILSLLTAEAMSAAEVARELDLTHANASYHLRALHDAGELVVESEEKIRGGVGQALPVRRRRATSHPASPAPTSASPTPAPRRAEIVATPPRRGAGHRHLQRPRDLGAPSRPGTGRSTCCTRPRTCCTPRPDRPAPPGTVHVSATHSGLHDAGGLTATPSLDPAGG